MHAPWPTDFAAAASAAWHPEHVAPGNRFPLWESWHEAQSEWPLGALLCSVEWHFAHAAIDVFGRWASPSWQLVQGACFEDGEAAVFEASAAWQLAQPIATLSPSRWAVWHFPHARSPWVSAWIPADEWHAPQLAAEEA